MQNARFSIPEDSIPVKRSINLKGEINILLIGRVVLDLDCIPVPRNGGAWEGDLRMIFELSTGRLGATPIDDHRLTLIFYRVDLGSGVRTVLYQPLQMLGAERVLAGCPFLVLLLVLIEQLPRHNHGATAERTLDLFCTPIWHERRPAVGTIETFGIGH